MNLLTIVFNDIQTATTAWGDLDVPKVKRERVDVDVIALFDHMVVVSLQLKILVHMTM